VKQGHTDGQAEDYIIIIIIITTTTTTTTKFIFMRKIFTVL
jgi:hypothetical protein